MNCLEKYRSKLVREINQNLRIVLESPEEEAVHEFRVGIKRLTAFYFFLHTINPEIQSKQILKPYRALFKSLGNIRDGHIALQLINDLNEENLGDRTKLSRAINASIRKDSLSFKKKFPAAAQSSIRVPTIASTGISERAILAQKQGVLDGLITEVMNIEGRISPKKWHKKRILLKRYHHIIDAFQFCAGHLSDEEEVKQIYMLQKLLGDWHDRITTIALLQSIEKLQSQAETVIDVFKKQDSLLLGSAKIYLNKYTIWQMAQ